MKTILLSIFIFITVPLFSQTGNTIHGEIRNASGKKSSYPLFMERNTPDGFSVVDTSGHLPFS